MQMLNISLDQLRALQAVIEHGGYAKAAEKLSRSQSSVSYQVARLQQQLDMQLLDIVGRKAELTANGEAVFKQAQQLLHENERLAQLVTSLKQDWEPGIHLVVDTAFPTALLMKALQLFEPVCRGTQVKLTEVVLSGAEEAILNGSADLAICARAPDGYLGERLLTFDFVAVAHPAHALHQLERELTSADLEKQLQVVINDSGVMNKMDVGWLAAEHQWSVSRIETSVSAISHGLGFGWLPEYILHDEKNSSMLKPLKLREGGRFSASLQLVFGNPDFPGPASRQLADCIKQTAKSIALSEL
jgi:DNA-binding transcriptional LysR family regulator